MLDNSSGATAVKVALTQHGRGTFAARAFASGEPVLSFAPRFQTVPDRYTIQVGVHKHLVTTDHPGSYLNHSCRPNLCMNVADLSVVAVRTIAAGEELSFDYESTEWELAAPFPCECGETHCSGEVRGYRHLSAAARHERAALVAEHLKELAALPWWYEGSISSGPEGLELDGQPVLAFARELGTPLYLYSGRTLQRRLHALRSALASTGAPFKLHYAMKANRYPPLLALIRAEGDVGIDCSSPREVTAALAAGFHADEISLTCSMPSTKDFQAFARAGVHLNLDTFSAIRRWAATPGHSQRIGLRIDPGVAFGYGDNPKLSYGNSKFGFAWAQLAEAYAFAEAHGLQVDTLHMHVGWGLQEKVAGLFAEVLAQVAAHAQALPGIETINVGGGLCGNQTASDRPLALSTWSALLRQHLGPLGKRIACESGTFLVHAAGLLLTEVTTVEERSQKTWLGVDCGHNVNCYAAHYSIPQEVIVAASPLAAPLQTVVLAGNINEANDIFARAVPLAAVAEGDILAFHPAGAYGASMASDHCLKGLPREHLLS